MAPFMFLLWICLKAYDRVSHYRLFSMLLDIDAPVYFVKLLKTWYTSQSMQVRWNNRLSQSFTVRNGVRQGSVLSPSLFNIYIDGLLGQLARSGYSAKVSYLYLGAIAYADDINLVSPTIHGMQQMLNICDTYAKDHGLVFNGKKSTSATFVKNGRRPRGDVLFTIGKEPLSCREMITHLGVVMDASRRETVAVQERRRKFYGAVNSVVYA